MNRKVNHAWLVFVRLLGMEEREERKDADSFIQISPAKERLFEELSDWENYRQRADLLKKMNIEWELQQVMHSARKRGLRVWLFRVAVVMLPLFAGGISTWLYFRSEKVEQFVDNLNPGKSGAVLVLSDGSEQDLTTGIKSIRERDGEKILVDSARLNYSVREEIKGKELIYNKLVVGRGFEYMLILNDGTKVWMNSASELHYPVTFGNDSRRVKLSGEAYFEVVKDSIRPFIVEVNQGFEISVLGTRFNVKAYDTDLHYETTLVEGSVRVTASGGNSVVLTPSEQICIGRDGKYQVRNVNPAYYTAWHEGWFYFNDESLEQVLREIGRWYDMDFVLTDVSQREISVTGKVKRFETLDVILNMLEKIVHVEFDISGKVITVK